MDWISFGWDNYLKSLSKKHGSLTKLIWISKKKKKYILEFADSKVLIINGGKYNFEDILYCKIEESFCDNNSFQQKYIVNIGVNDKTNMIIPIVVWSKYTVDEIGNLIQNILQSRNEFEKSKDVDEVDNLIQKVLQSRNEFEKSKTVEEFSKMPKDLDLEEHFVIKKKDENTIELTKAEERVMRVLWKIERGFANEIMANYPEPKPAYNTVLTIVRILEKKGVVAHETYCKSNRYYPLISKSDYSRSLVKKVMDIEDDSEKVLTDFSKESCTKQFISWRRTPLKKSNGYNLETQKDIIDYFVEKEKGVLIADYEEVYEGVDLNGCQSLKCAIEHCKAKNAILIIAKVDRFADEVEAMQVYEEMGEGNIYFCDLPKSDKSTLSLFFSFAERNRLFVSLVTKKSLKKVKDSGKKLGAPTNDNIKKAQIESAKARMEKAKHNDNNMFVKLYIEDFEKRNDIVLRGGIDGVWFERIADELNSLGKKTQKGLEWNKDRVYSIVKRIKERYRLEWGDESVETQTQSSKSKSDVFAYPDFDDDNKLNNDEAFATIETKSLTDEYGIKHISKESKHQVEIDKQISRVRELKIQKSNENEQFFKSYIENFEKRNNVELVQGVDIIYFKMLTNELKKLGKKTNAGLVLNSTKVYNIVRTIKLKYGLNWEKTSINKTNADIDKSERQALVSKSQQIENNYFFKSYIEKFEQRNGIELTKGIDSVYYQKLADELNNLGRLTNTGLEWNKSRVYSMVRTIKLKYGLNWFGGAISEQNGNVISKRDGVVEIDKQKLESIKKETLEAQSILSNIFVEEDNDENNPHDIKEDNPIMDILKSLLNKEQWQYSEVEELCKKYNVMMGFVLERINDYAFEKIENSVIDDDGEFIYVSTEYKNKLI